MSTSKRRRPDDEELPHPMSAFALRKKLLAQQSQAASAPIDQADAIEAIAPTDASETVESPQKKSKRTKAVRKNHAQREEAVSRPKALLLAQDASDPREPEADQIESVAGDLSPLALLEEFGMRDGRASSVVQPINLSSFRPSKGNFCRRKNGISQLKLEGGERLVILGSYGIRAESGEVVIYGASLKSSESVSWVHAPQSHALPVIRCIDDAVLELQSHPGAQGLVALESLSPLFRKIWCHSPVSPVSVTRETFQILYAFDDVPKKTILQDLKSPPEWNRDAARFVTLAGLAPSSFMITGPKSSGKSTFGRILTNRLLTNVYAHAKKSSHAGVVILDLDPGQPEYCSNGHIALVLVTEPVLSPAFCRPFDTPGTRIIRSHALASLSPASDPALYSEMAVDLIAHYRNGFGSLPLIINTPGWIQGTGLDLLVSLVSELRPSEVVYMSQSGPGDTVEALQEACRATRFSTLPSQPNQTSLRVAIDLRNMQTMAYFHSEPKVHKSGDHPSWLPKPLTTIAPWQVRFKGNNRGIFGVLCYDFQTQSDLVADAINGTILAAVEVENTKAFRNLEDIHFAPGGTGDEVTSGSPMEMDTEGADQTLSPSLSLLQEKIVTLTPEGIPFIDTTHGLTLDPRYSRSLGMVLVRGIDTDRGDFHFLSPISMGQVEDVKARGGQIVLISGKFDPPSWAYTEDFFFRSEGDGSEGNGGIESDNQSKAIDADVEGAVGDDSYASHNNAEAVPWIEFLSRNQRRGAGSKVWRVRRDLGRGGNTPV